MNKWNFQTNSILKQIQTVNKIPEEPRTKSPLPWDKVYDEYSEAGKWLQQKAKEHSLTPDAHELNQYYLQHVFVYGSLKRGFRNSGLMKDSMFVSEALTVRKNFRMFGCKGYHCNFPVVLERQKDAVERESEASIHGEVFLCDRKTIGNLDILERNGVMYTREIQRVYNPDINKTFEVWMYISNTNYWYSEMDKLAPVGREDVGEGKKADMYYWMEEHERALI